MARGDTAARGEAVTMAIRIVDEGLRAALDERGGEISRNLRALYDYVLRRLLVGSARNDHEALEEAAKLLTELQGAWLAIAPQARAV
jgi:flagellar protein FliS